MQKNRLTSRFHAPMVTATCSLLKAEWVTGKGEIVGATCIHRMMIRMMMSKIGG
jgi:hypothetical protein